MDVVTAEQMRALDRETIERLGIPAIADGERRAGHCRGGHRLL